MVALADLQIAVQLPRVALSTRAMLGA
jgi:hypothetical protein